MRRIVFLGLAWLSCMLAYGQNLNRIEYFIDNDPGYGSATNVPFTAAAAVTDLTFSVPLGSVSDGFHALYIRSRDVSNRWSVVQSRPFYKVPASALAAPPNLNRIEYFIDTDPGYGAGTNVPFTTGTTVTDLAFTVPLGSVSDGFHTLFIRARDANNRWSVVQSRPFYKVPASALAAAPNLNRIEYFVDTDPGYGNGTNVPFTAGTSVTDLVFSVNVSALTEGNHKLYVRSRDANNKWSIIQIRDFTVCNQAVPVPAAATAITTTGFTANWAAASGATSYRLDVSADNFATFVTGNNDRAVTGATSASVTGLTAGVAYKYRVRAVNATCTSLSSTVIDVTTLFSAPTANTATSINATGFTANWSAVSGAAGYRLDVSADNFVTFVTGYNNKTVTGTNDPVTGLAPSTAYKYRVRAVSASSVLSANSNEISVTTAALPAAPVAIAATNVSTTGFTANWNAVSGVTGYRLDVSADNFTTLVAGFSDKTVTTTNDAVTGLISGTAYKYRVRAVNANGTSANSNVIDVTTAATPAAPVATAATSVTNVGFTANWNAVTGATGYRLDVSTDNFATFITGFNNKTVSTTSDVVTGLTAATAYKYRVRAVNANGTSVNSNVIDVTTLATPRPPDAPVATAAISISQTGFTANWNAVTGATGYRLDVSADNFATFVTGFGDKSVSGTNDAVTGLAATTAYKYRVRAVNANGTSVNSNVIDVTTLAKQDQTISFAAIADKTVGDAPFPLGATASSGLAITYATGSDKVTIANGVATIVKAGRESVEASQPGNAQFNPAATVVRSFCIKPARPTITLGPSGETVVLTSSSATGNQWFRDGTLITNTSAGTLNVTQPGVYSLRVQIDDCQSEASANVPIIVTGDFTITPEQNWVYPNPVTDRLYVSFKSFARGSEVQVRLVDMNGKVLQKQTGQGGETVELSMAGYVEGSYLVTAEQGKLREQVKIVKE